MTKQIDNGGPAFPFDHYVDGGSISAGMTLRDYFAAQVAAGDAASGDGWSGPNYDIGTPEGAKRRFNASAIERAKMYYAIADAMLKVRTA